MRRERNKELQKRIEDFVVTCLSLASKLAPTVVNQQILRQLIDAVSSIGANYEEACEAESARDFVHKIMIAKKECRETLYWLRILYRLNPSLKDELETSGKEAGELLKIFSSIVAKFKN